MSLISLSEWHGQVLLTGPFRSILSRQTSAAKFITALLLLQIVSAKVEWAPTCANHLANDVTKNPVLIRAWDLLHSFGVNNRVVYQARFERYNYTPIGEPTSAKYKGLDFFYAGGSSERTDPEFVRLLFQRPARIYLFVHAYGDLNEASLGDWKSEGWAMTGKDVQIFSYGIHQKSTMNITPYVYVFSKPTMGSANEITVPEFGWVAKHFQGHAIGVNGHFHLRIAEADGSASKPPARFRGVEIIPNVPCPDILHNTWSVLDDNWEDADTKGVQFATWHPTWDPCYWCAYDHDHGSSAPILMDYQPKYGYVQQKNNRTDDEPNPGFKDFVVATDGYLLYFSSHMQTSSLRRVTTRFHAITIAVKTRDGTLMAELTFKADFGYLSARSQKKGQFVALTPRDAALQASQEAALPHVGSLRTVNVIDEGNLDSRFEFRDSAHLMLGTYEQWTVEPPCTSAKRPGKLTFDTQNSCTGVKSEGRLGTAIELGGETTEGFYRNTALMRTVRANKFTISASLCSFGEDFKGGYFYTDVYGKELRSGPGRSAVRQYIKPGFGGSFSGRWLPVEQWLGLHQGDTDDTDLKNFFKDSGYGINPRVN